jgi:hypothetical protein
VSGIVFNPPSSLPKFKTEVVKGSQEWGDETSSPEDDVEISLLGGYLFGGRLGTN